ADREVVRWEAQLERNQQQRAALREAATCERGDVEEYRRLGRRTRDVDDRGRATADAEILGALVRVRPGDVLHLPGGKSGGRVAVLSTSRRKGGDIRIRALTPERRVVMLSPRDFTFPPRAIGHLDLPTPYAPNSHTFQRAVAQALVKARVRDGGGGGASRQSRRAVSS